MGKRRAQIGLRLARRLLVGCLLCAFSAWAGVPAVPDAGLDFAETPTPVDTAAAQFAVTCSNCHTIGGGVSRGPDLAGVAAWPEAQLTSAVQSMARKVGPLSSQQVQALVALLKDRSVHERIDKARASVARVSDEPTQPVDSLLGGAIFFGYVALSNGGMPCSSCHQFRGEGGDLAPDLSQFAANTEIEALAGTIERAGFPVMRAAYQEHPITQQEARNLAGFMKQSKSKRAAAVFADTTAWGIGAGLGAFAIVVALILARPKGVRARLIQRATKR